MHIPTDGKMIAELSGMPIHQFTMNHYPDNIPVNMSQCRFTIEQDQPHMQRGKPSLFAIGVHTGELSLVDGVAFQKLGKLKQRETQPFYRPPFTSTDLTFR